MMHIQLPAIAAGYARRAGVRFVRFLSHGLWLLATAAIMQIQLANAGDLRMEVITAYNFVVDSNVESPLTNGPSAATWIYNSPSAVLLVAIGGAAVVLRHRRTQC